MIRLNTVLGICMFVVIVINFKNYPTTNKIKSSTRKPLHETTELPFKEQLLNLPALNQILPHFSNHKQPMEYLMQPSYKLSYRDRFKST